MIKSVANLSLSGVYQKYFLRTFINFTFSNANTKLFYPYVFGGLKKINVNENMVCKQALRTYFGQESFDGFKEAYKSFLYQLAQRDLQNIKEIIEPTMYDRLKLRNVELINPDAQIQVICSDLFFVIGGGFNRNNFQYSKMGSTNTKQIQPYETAKQYVQRNMYIGNQAGSIKKGLSALSYNPPTLMAFDILFRSSMKLIPEGGSRSDNPQIHSLQFQIQGKLDMTPLNIIKTYLDIKVMGYFKPLQTRKKVLLQILGDNYEWKIGDVDRVLNKNLNLKQ